MHVTWDLIEAEQRRVRLCWRENGGPQVTAPQRTGFGTALIERALDGAERGTQFQFAPEGVVCVFEIPL